jgi:hypothetical protein
MENVQSVMNGTFQSGSFAGVTAFLVKMKYAPLPATVWVQPSAGTVSVLYSVDDGVNYTAVTALTSAAAFSDTVLTGPITNLKFVGDGSTAAGTWGVC